METSLIIVVEDNPSDAKMTLRALGQLVPPVPLTWAHDGAEALQLLKESEPEKPDLMFLDLKMPGLHGFEVLKAIRENPSFQTLPIVVLTSSSDPYDQEEAERLGANAYVCKPMDFEEYFRIVCATAAQFLPSVVCKL